jgi:hypothetical protein
VEIDSSNDAEFKQLGINDCARLPIEMPRQWQSLPIRVSVSLILTGSNGVSNAFFENFAVTSVAAAIEHLVTMEDENLVYTFSVDGAIPMLGFDADWPLLRRSHQNCFATARVKAQGAEPWAWSQDRTLFEVYRKPFDDDPLCRSSVYGGYGGRPGGRLHLRVGGMTSEQASSDWNKCAKVLRALHRSLKSTIKLSASE